MALGLDRNQIREEIFRALRRGRARTAAAAAVSREVGYQVTPAPPGDQQWIAINAMFKEVADAVADIIEENNAMIERQINEMLQKQSQ